MLDNVYDAISVGDVVKPKKKAPVPVETVAIAVGLYILSKVPLWHSTVEAYNMVFARHGTLMTLGTGPFISSAMAYNLAFKDKNERHALLCGLALSLAQSAYMGLTYGAPAAFALAAMSFVIFNAIRICRELGQLDLSSALIIANASQRLFEGDVLSTCLTFIIVCGVSYLNNMCIPVRLMHTKSRHITSTRLPLMYSGNTPLVVYYTLSEFSPIGVPLLVGLPFIYGLAMYWPTVAETTGHDLLREYEEKDFTLKGWRDKKRMGKHIHRQVDTLVRYNAAILVAMAVVSYYLRPSVNCGTLLIVTQALASLEPRDELRTLQRQGSRALRRKIARN